MVNADFLPYQVLEDGPTGLRLQLSRGQQWLHWALFRILPFFIGGMLALVVSDTPSDTPWWFYGALLFVCWLALYLIAQPIIRSATIRPDMIIVEELRFFRYFQHRVEVQEVARIELVFEWHTRGSRARYDWVMHNGARKAFAYFPVVWGQKQHKFAGISKKIQQITGLEVRHDPDLPQ